jgi:hypothetical protein
MVSLQERPHGNSRGILSKMAIQNSLKRYLLAKLGAEASGFKTYEIILTGLEKNHFMIFYDMVWSKKKGWLMNDCMNWRRIWMKTAPSGKVGRPASKSV